MTAPPFAMPSPESHAGSHAAVDHRPIRAMSAEERRAYNRMVKQRSRAKAALKTRSGSLPSTKEAAVALVAVAASRLALEDPGVLSGRLALEVASLVGAPCDEGFQAKLGALLRRIASPRRMTVNMT